VWPSQAVSGIGQVWKLSKYLLGDLATLRQYSVVDGPRLLITLLGEVHFDLGAEPDNVKGVKDGNRLGQPVMNGVRISPKWVQRSLLHAVDEPVGLGFQPGLVDAPGAADDGI
jgi:hypothetical protein